VDLYPPAAGARVIDFATGTGIVALAAAGGGAVRFLEQSIEALEAPAGSFDVAYCSFAIVLLAELQPFLARVRHLLTPGGFLAFTSSSAESHFNPQMLAAAAGAGIALPPIHGPLASAAAIRRQLQQAGFGSCRITSLPLQEAQRRWDGRLWLHPHDPLAAAPAATVVAIKREFDRRLEAESRDGLVWAEERIHYVKAGLRDCLPGAILEGTSGAQPCPATPPQRNPPGKRRSRE